MKPLLDSEVKALFKLRFVTPIDLLLFGAWMAVTATAIYFWSTEKLTVQLALILLFLQLTVTAGWILLVLFRVCYHVFKLRADVMEMPQAAANLALSYQLKP